MSFFYGPLAQTKARLYCVVPGCHSRTGSAKAALAGGGSTNQARRRQVGLSYEHVVLHVTLDPSAPQTVSSVHARVGLIIQITQPRPILRGPFSRFTGDNGILRSNHQCAAGWDLEWSSHAENMFAIQQHHRNVQDAFQAAAEPFTNIGVVQAGTGRVTRKVVSQGKICKWCMAMGIGRQAWPAHPPKSCHLRIKLICILTAFTQHS